MTGKNIQLTDRLHRYLLDVSLREPPILGSLREETAQLPLARMQISPEQGQFMALLVRLMRARRVLEVGVFTGYSSLSMALAMPADGHLVACDVSEEWTATARRYWNEAGVADRIELRLGPALPTLDALLESGAADSFDMAFVDADKAHYDAYYERALRLLRPGGLLLIDNVLWSGRVIEPQARDDDTLALRALNKKIHADERVSISMLPLADGLTLAMKR
ncbi:MAG: class I SAM-dependent methyltransferase [Gammaproteobacteria bacterium]